MDSNEDIQNALPLGFRFGAVKAGIKASGKLDFACAVPDQPAAAAVLFTSNRVVAAPIAVGRAHLAAAPAVRVVVINAGNANCATGPQGIQACEEVCRATAVTFGCSAAEVFPSSTGIIGVPLPVDKLTRALPDLHSAVGRTAEHFTNFSSAIMTTDTRLKTAFASFKRDGATVRIAGACKGAGMIHPQLVPHATMLVYLFTDADADAAELQHQLTQVAEQSFNRISIDGDTSTNDTVLLLASGASGVTLARNDGEFAAALESVCISLARQIIDDGEGVTHVIELAVNGAASDADALRVARAIAHSPLVKTAWSSADPNWGRLIAAIGYSGVPIDPEEIAIWIGSEPVCERGGRAAAWDEAAAHAIMTQRSYTIRIELGAGGGSCRFWTTDLTAEYVRINADYST